MATWNGRGLSEGARPQQERQLLWDTADERAGDEIGGSVFPPYVGRGTILRRSLHSSDRQNQSCGKLQTRSGVLKGPLRTVWTRQLDAVRRFLLTTNLRLDFGTDVCVSGHKEWMKRHDNSRLWHGF